MFQAFRSAATAVPLSSSNRRASAAATVVTFARRYLKTLTVNAGSTTLKYGVYDVKRLATASLLASGMVDRIGRTNACITHNQEVAVQNEPILDHLEGVNRVLDDILSREMGIDDFDCIGHRVVHGGSKFTCPTIIDEQVLDEIRALSSLAPLHNPPAIAAIEASLNRYPDTKQVAVFDTAFHTASMPPEAYRYALPDKLYEDHGVRRYGFHGTSYAYVVEQVAKYMGKPAESLNIIAFHLGGGASACCMRNGKSIATTMGFTPLEGLVMATRPGDMDPGIQDYLMRHAGYTADEVYNILNKESGMFGLTGSADMRAVIDRALDGDSDCILARQIFVERCRRYLGSFILKLGGKVDAIVFTGGIGENDFRVRRRILNDLEELKIVVDEAKNEIAINADQVMEIQTPLAKTKVLVVPTDEEVSIALQSAKLVLPLEDEPAPKKAPTIKKFNTNLVCHSVGHSYTGAQELGLLSVFSAFAERVGYFRPIGRYGAKDYRIELMKKHFGLEEDAEMMCGVDETEAWQLISEGKEDALFELILKKYIEYAATKDFVLVSTFNNTEGDDSLHLNAKIVSALNIPAVFIGDKDHDGQFNVAQSAFNTHGAQSLGVIVTDVDDFEAERAKLKEMKLKPVVLLPKSDVLAKRTVHEVMKVLDDSMCLYGSEHLDSPVDHTRIYTMQVDDMLPEIGKDELIMVHHKRVDTLMAIILAAQSSNSPTPAGVLFTMHKKGSMKPKIESILSGIDDIRIPVIATSADTIEAARMLENTTAFLAPESKEKIEAARTMMEVHLDFEFLEKFNGGNGSNIGRNIGPRLFQYSAFLKARELQKTIVLPEGADPRVVEAASILSKRQLCNVVVIGDPQVIRANAEKVRASLDNVTIIDPQRYDRFDEMVDAFVEARKSKGLTRTEAERYLLEDVNYFGTMMMYMGTADGMVSGAMHSSANTIRPALQILKTAPGASLVSSIFFMLLEDGVRVFGDCAINTMPDSEQLSEIAVASAKTAKQFGIEPRVALLSYATGDSNKGELVDKVINATKIAKEKAQSQGFMDADLIQGPLQFDAAVDPAVAAVKAKNNPVAGRANVLIFPDLNSGNNGYKAVQQATKTIAVGPILQGLRKPVNDLSRGATVDDIVNTAVFTALQAHDVE